MGRIAEIVLEGATFGYDRKYLYSVPEEFDDNLEGCRAIVPFGRGNRKKQGMILKVAAGSGEGLKSIISAVDSVPVLNSEMLSKVLSSRPNISKRDFNRSVEGFTLLDTSEKNFLLNRIEKTVP